jgi:glutamine amidotransferase
VYKGKSFLIGDIVIKPQNSLLFQSRDAAYHPGVVDKTNRRNILVNGDGFGVAWYGKDISKGSCCFKFVTPAWSNENLRNIGEHVYSSLIFAHIRAASSGHDPNEKVNVSHENCHPFKSGRYTFMHNGGIPHFSKIKLSLLKLLSEKAFQEIKGSTDSEHIFALFLQFLPIEKQATVEEMINALNLSISTILYLCSVIGIQDHCSFNICVTDGVNIIATRFRDGPEV